MSSFTDIFKGKDDYSDKDGYPSEKGEGLMVSGNSNKYKIILVDDYPPVRRMVKALIEANPELQVVGELSDGSALMQFLETSSAQMVVLDISMPFMSGFEATRRVKKGYPEVKVLILSIHNYKEYVERAISAGAEGYLLKEQAGDELLAAITSLRAGQSYISSHFLSRNSTRTLA
jgi:DNA-binding NarL/FixJ family response regulator